MAALFKLIAALAFVIALMLAFAYIVKRWGVAQMKMQGKDSRLKVIENIPIDARHRAVLLQRDDVQHLVCLLYTSPSPRD